MVGLGSERAGQAEGEGLEAMRLGEQLAQETCSWRAVREGSFPGVLVAKKQRQRDLVAQGRARARAC